MCHWVSDIPYQVLTAVATRKQMLLLSTDIEWFQWYLSQKDPEKEAVWKRASFIWCTFYQQLIHKATVPNVTRMSLVFLKCLSIHLFSLTLPFHTAMLGKRPQLSKLLKYDSIKCLFFPSLLWLFVKQHNGGFVPAIWSTVKYSWPVDAMPTTASKWITLCWRIMDIYSSGILFTIFCKK